MEKDEFIKKAQALGYNKEYSREAIAEYEKTKAAGIVPLPLDSLLDVLPTDYP